MHLVLLFNKAEKILSYDEHTYGSNNIRNSIKHLIEHKPQVT